MTLSIVYGLIHKRNLLPFYEESEDGGSFSQIDRNRFKNDDNSCLLLIHSFFSECNIGDG